MDELAVSTEVYVPPAEAFEFVVDFTGYAEYADVLEEVRREGDGGEGTCYDLVFSWWKLRHTTRSRVTGIDRPARVDWEIAGEFDARGSWLLEAVQPPDGHDDATRIRFHLAFDPSTLGRALDLPMLVSPGWVLEQALPLVEREARRIVERVVADLEGEPRPVELEVDSLPDGV